MKTYCRLSYRIPFSETDAMGIVHHSNHARYLERGRVEFLRLVEMDYAGVVKEGFHVPLTEMKVVFKRPLVFDDVVMIETEVSMLTKTRLNFSYRIFAGQSLAAPTLSNELFAGTPSVVGETFHCCVNDKGRPVELPARMHKKLLSLGAS